MGLKFARAVAPVLSSSPIMLSLLPPHINSSISQIPSPGLVLTSFTASFAVNALKCMLGKLLRDCFCHHRAAAKVKRSWPLPLYWSRLQQRCMDPPIWTLPPQQALILGDKLDQGTKHNPPLLIFNILSWKNKASHGNLSIQARNLVPGTQWGVYPSHCLPPKLVHKLPALRAFLLPSLSLLGLLVAKCLG